MTDRLTELTNLLSEAARAYEQEDREIMSNYEYDRLYDELKRLEEETGIILANSPTVNVGYEVLSALPKETHESPMLSLDKTKSREELSAWLKDKEGVLSWKLDGLTIVLTYKDGRLLKAVTRGNGEVGEVITNNARVFKNLPLSIPFRGELVLRGEAVIRYSDFEKINATIENPADKYKNPRNLCSGTVRQLNNEITAQRNVYLYAFALIDLRAPGDTSEAAVEIPALPLRSMQLDWLASQGFEVVERKKVNSETVISAVNEFSGKIPGNDFPSDGLVLIYDDIAYGKSLGRTSKFPRDGIAFKWADEIKETVLREVEWSASRTGLINPVAIFDPVELEGTTVSRASLHNISIMEQLELNIGDTVTVYKANMIIPQIADNLTRSGMMHTPDFCPVCGEKTYIRHEKEVKALFCPNADCPAKKVKLFAHFAGRDAMNLEGLSEATIEKLIDAGMLHKPADFFRLEKHAGQIAEMEGFGEKSCKNLLASIEKARQTTLPKLIYSLGIPNVGLSNAKLICSALRDGSLFAADSRNNTSLAGMDADIAQIIFADRETLTAIPGIGEVIAGSFADYFADDANLASFTELLSEVVLIAEAASSLKLEGKTFVITGSVMHFANRSELKKTIEANGGKVTGSVTGKTDFLINNDSTSGSSKNKTAKELGVSIITEDEFLKLIE